MKSACGLRESVLMRKGYRKWFLKFRLKAFQRRHSYELRLMAFEVWKERTRSCMSLSATSVSICEQVCVCVCMLTCVFAYKCAYTYTYVHTIDIHMYMQ